MGNQPSQIEPTSSYVEDLDFPLIPVWNAIKSFGTWATWFPAYKSMEIIGNGKDEIGSIRSLVTRDNVIIEEKLTERDHNTHFIGYEMISRTPDIPIIRTMSSKVLAETISSGKTRLTWATWIETYDTKAPGIDLKQFAIEQQNSYQIATKALLQHLIFTKVFNETLNTLNSKRIAFTQALLIGQSKVWGYENYPKSVGKMPKMVKGLPFEEHMTPHKMGQMITSLLEVAYLQVNRAVTSKDVPYDNKQESLGLVNYAKSHPMDTVELTKYIIEHVDDDLSVCEQFIQGVCPMHIQLVTDISQVPLAMRDLKGQGKSIPELIVSKRLFKLDYKDLEGLKSIPGRYMYAPVVLVYKELTNNNNGRLNMLGIQLEPSKAGSPVYTPQMKHENRYKLAKLFAACADNHIHEFRYHLCFAHFIMEPVIVATHNTIPEGNPLLALLKPHLEGTIGINFLGRQSLLAEKFSIVDTTFSLGNPGAFDTMSKFWCEYDFFKFSFPEQLKARGFDQAKSDGLDNYHYRDDGFLLWNSIGDYVWTVITHFYENDEAVKKDHVVQRWAKEISSEEGANMPGFPSIIDSRKLLMDVLQIIIWNGSALHSAVNFPQWTYRNFAQNRPNAVYMPMPEDDGKDISEQYLKKAMVPPYESLLQLAFSWALTVPSETCLTNLTAMKEICPEAHYNFQERLEAITKHIKARNGRLKKEGKLEYIFLLPENVACSVNI